MQIAKILDKASTTGALISAISCAGCFPALGSLGIALGLGFLAPVEGLMFRKLLPAFAALALLANLVAWYRHKDPVRGVLSVMGPVAVLLALLAFWQYDWSIYLFYVGLALMVAVSLFDLFQPVTQKMPDVILQSEITCPYCGHSQLDTMPTNACQWFYECAWCKKILEPQAGDCCVYCSYGTVKCPPMQLDRPCCG